MAMFFRGGFSSMPPVTKNIIIINALIWLVEVIWPQFGFNGIVHHLGLHYVTASWFNPAQLITYMFVHDQRTFFHIFFNMLTLFFFGPALERLWGSKRFLFYYMVCGVGAALIQEGVWAIEWSSIVEKTRIDNPGFSMDEILKSLEPYKNNFVTVGASGAIFGLLLGFAFVFPNIPMYLFFIPVPIKAKYMVAGYAVLEFFFGISNTMGYVAHFAHLGGMLFGLFIILYWKKKGTLHGNGYF